MSEVRQQFGLVALFLTKEVETQCVYNFFSHVAALGFRTLP